MILVRLMGGLGNQMFQYAAGKSLAWRTGDELALDTSLLGPPTNPHPAEPIRNFDLDVFAPPDRFATDMESALFNGHPTSCVLKMVHRLARATGRYPLLVQRGNEFHDELLHRRPGNLCLVGRWQSEDYFADHRSRIKEAFCFRDLDIDPYARRIASQCASEQSVVIQTRRKDYVTHPTYSRMLGALDYQYYYDALDLLRSRLGDPNLRVYVGGDDMPWCVETFRRLPNVVFLESTFSKQSYCSHLWLLTHFRHNVISNSTFAWWGAWLGEKPDSVIIAPSRWSREPDHSPVRLIPSRWTRVDNDFERLA